ncbi:DUF4124 domain-containing protein [Variovorax sp. M-6]|uniref:DUF4124 domain-containing protein n=1 Tax=Variovorax sp. M-6 TaxID=3233041 RepID=UPI003F9816AB
MPFLVQHVARTIVVFSICAASAVASAEIHRCKDERGQTVLSDRPCGSAFSGQPLQSGAHGSGADRLAVPDMHTVRVRGGGGQYDFIPAHRSIERRSEKQALR